ncbi:hypothetical protein NPA09_01865 [Mycoplasmopsis equigenitalium]|uniref:Uncharacterized protein n=1 Tax=Mycoplasmopsis equigenitalium TaxID=114883 RepID=A0ABY5J6I7_9BACT|nr:hypothetical protein [Mycoplasmopsis equigenitalium]UUD37298.1 hypothetical protein NPA09_01865 [Mycoplasmopsis equigenitalium]
MKRKLKITSFGLALALVLPTSAIASSCNKNQLPNAENNNGSEELITDLQTLKTASEQISVDYANKNTTLVKDVKLEDLKVDNSKIDASIKDQIKITKTLLTEFFNTFAGEIVVEITTEYKNQKISKTYNISGFATENFDFMDFINRIKIDVDSELKKYSATDILAKHIQIIDPKQQQFYVDVNIVEKDGITCDKNAGKVNVEITFTNRFNKTQTITKTYEITGFNIYKIVSIKELSEANQVFSFSNKQENIDKIKELISSGKNNIHILEGKFYSDASLEEAHEIKDVFSINQELNPLWISTVQKTLKFKTDNVVGYIESDPTSTPIVIAKESVGGKSVYYLKWYLVKNDNTLDKTKEYKLKLFEE